MITTLFVLVLAVAWVLTRPRPGHSPTVITIIGEWTKCLFSRDDDGDDDGDDTADDDDPGEVSEHNWGAVGAPEPGRFQSIGPLPAPRPAKDRPELSDWQEYALDAKLKGHRPADIKRSIRALYGVSPATFDRFVTKAKEAGRW
jgi:hypothetical protein